MVDVKHTLAVLWCMTKNLARLIRKNQLQLFSKYGHDGKQVVEVLKSYALTKSLATFSSAPQKTQTLFVGWIYLTHNALGVRKIKETFKLFRAYGGELACE